jgi:hypothetical protein
MNLHDYDGKCVRIIDKNGDVFDGICSYNNSEYDKHEFGCNEESLEICNFVFYKSDIEEIQSLEKHKGPYGKFLDPYGRLEEMIVEDGIDSIIDIFESEENEHIYRLLNCLDKYLDPYYGYGFSCRDETIKALRKLINETNDINIKEEANRLVEMWG